MIEKMGFTDYFLLVSDFRQLCQGVDIPRWAGARQRRPGMVSYCLDITDIDPMKYDLYFERFLTRARVHARY